VLDAAQESLPSALRSDAVTLTPDRRSPLSALLRTTVSGALPTRKVRRPVAVIKALRLVVPSTGLFASST
jgi:hypothetical protein